MISPEVYDHVRAKGLHGEYEVVALTTDGRGAWICSVSALKQNRGLVMDRAFVTNLHHLDMAPSLRPLGVELPVHEPR